MINLSHDQLSGITPPWYWMVTDRVGEFDDVLRRPMKNFKAILSATERYFEMQSKNDPSGPSTQTSNNIRYMLDRLEDAGEDVGRIYEWGRALDFQMDVFTNDKVHPSEELWWYSLARWRPDELAKLDRPGPDVRDRLHASWEKEVRQPSAALEQRVKIDKNAWLKNESRRSDWDNFMWEKWFKEFEYDPATVAADGYRQMLFREWWRKIGKTVTPEEQSQMMRWHEEGSLASDTDGFLEPYDIGWIGDALRVDLFPPFFGGVARAK